MQRQSRPAVHRGSGALTRAVRSIARSNRDVEEGLFGVRQKMIKAVRQVALDVLDRRLAIARVDDAEMVHAGQ